MTAAASGGALREGLRLSLTTLTSLPLGKVQRVDRTVAGWAMTLAPLAGAVVGLGAAGVLLAAYRWAGTGPLLAAVLALAAAALLTRGLHLDGLADLADGLGSGRPAEGALAIMKRSDIGPFGVVTLGLTLLLQTAALAQATAHGRGAAAVVVAAVTGRLAVSWACRTGVPAARPEGLGALVAGTVGPVRLVAVSAVVLAATAPAGPRYPLSVAAGLALAAAVRRHAVRRLGGVTGDVLGALVEVAATAALIVAAIR